MDHTARISALTAAVLCFGCCTMPVSAEPAMRDISTKELVRDMGIDINLGNTLEACGDWIAEYSSGQPTDYETAWGSPVITKEMHCEGGLRRAPHPGRVVEHDGTGRYLHDQCRL